MIKTVWQATENLPGFCVDCRWDSEVNGNEDFEEEADEDFEEEADEDFKEEEDRDFEVDVDSGCKINFLKHLPCRESGFGNPLALILT